MSDEMRDVRETLGAPQDDTFLSDEARRREAQKHAAEVGADTLDLEVGDELDLSAQPATPREAVPAGEHQPVVALRIHLEEGERDCITLTVDGEERARAFLDEIPPEVLEQAKVTADPREQARLIWPDPPQAPAGEVSAAEGLKQQMEKASGTSYVIFEHVDPPADSGDRWQDGIRVKSVGADGATELRALTPVAVGSFTGAPAALLAARERFGAGDYVAIPLRNVTAKSWRKATVDKWV